jgi:hypothetical protein
MTPQGRFAVSGYAFIGATLLGCTPSSLSTSREIDGAFADGAGPGRLLADASHDAKHPYYDAAPRMTGADAGVNCPHVGGGSSNPRSYCAVRCKSIPPTSDVQVWLDQTSVPQNGADGPVPSFVVRIVQTVPTPCDQTFSDVQTLWTGQFMNFSGQNSQWQFHLLAAPPNTDANVEVDPLGASSDSGPVSVGTYDHALVCQIYTP